MSDIYSRLYLRVVSFTIEEYFSALSRNYPDCSCNLANLRFDTHTREPSLFPPMQTQMIGKMYLASVYIENEIYRNCVRVCLEKANLIHKSFSRLPFKRNPQKITFI